MKLAKGAGRADDDDRSTLLNVDLEVFSRVPLHRLAAAFGERVSVLYVGKWGRQGQAACVEIAGGGYRANADRLIRQFVALVQALPKPARRLWDGAQRRDFNLGIEAARRAPLLEVTLEPETVAAVASVKGRIVITVYAPERLPVSRPSKQVSRRRNVKR